MILKPYSTCGVVSIASRWIIPNSLSLYFKNVGTLSQTTILRTNSQIVGTHTFRNFFLSRIHFKIFVIVAKQRFCAKIKWRMSFCIS
ncbi:hypothetical protein LEP1GSC132_3224 [Leptospira kirschneri str. 200803703]|nr:hypothetical protein LEP1GSC132_3224 [Leptospira kirschneri str. 200803703]EMO77306.1 hypothetical protein LEP1GSC127_3710 [Leptospira kirschneri str. 200801925]